MAARFGVHDSWVRKVRLRRRETGQTGTKPHSPDLSPIKAAWSKVKALLRKAAARTDDTVLEAVTMAVRTVSATDARGWFEPRGYVPSG